MKIGNPIRNIPFILTKIDSVKRKKKKELKGEANFVLETRDNVLDLVWKVKGLNLLLLTGNRRVQSLFLGR